MRDPADRQRKREGKAQRAKHAAVRKLPLARRQGEGEENFWDRSFSGTWYSIA